MIKNRPRRFDIFYFAEPVFFVTFCTRNRTSISIWVPCMTLFCSYCERSPERNVAVGRYVIMPDHIHLFVKSDANFVLSRWIGGLKTLIAVKLGFSSRQLRQPGFFDRVLRSNESYAEKWSYVLQNPVRAGSVADVEDWPYRGEIMMIDRV